MNGNGALDMEKLNYDHRRLFHRSCFHYTELIFRVKKNYSFQIR
jgi:hypothetical protein